LPVALTEDGVLARYLFVASTVALIATGWSEPVPGRIYPRCEPPPFHGAPGYPNLPGATRYPQLIDTGR